MLKFTAITVYKRKIFQTRHKMASRSLLHDTLSVKRKVKKNLEGIYYGGWWEKMSHRRLLVFKVYFSPLFDTPSASRTIVTSQTSQYFNTAVTVPPPLLTPRTGPYHGYALKKPSPTVEPAGGGIRRGMTHKHLIISTPLHNRKH